MSILRTATDNYGDEIIGAYSKIVSQSSDNNGDKTNFTYQVQTWKSQAAYESGKPCIQSLNHRDEVMMVHLESVDIAGLYAHLMTHDSYKDGAAV